MLSSLYVQFIGLLRNEFRFHRVRLRLSSFRVDKYQFHTCDLTVCPIPFHKISGLVPRVEKNTIFNFVFSLSFVLSFLSTIHRHTRTHTYPHIHKETKIFSLFSLPFSVSFATFSIIFLVNLF